MAGYDHQEIEKKAQEKWAALDLYTTDLKDDSRDPYYLLVEFPYPSGDLHIGHWYAFSVTDIYARLLRLQGKNVLFPIGFDAFGLPAENAAIKHGVDPAKWTMENIERMRTQLKSMGPSFDWSKEVIACDPNYYKWTQWLFTKLFEHNLAERREAPVKWCPKDQTVLANEQVIDGKCERCGSEVEEKRLTQWFLKITEYAERLLTGLEHLPWREEIKEAQRAWIGKSEGAYLTFPIAAREEAIKVFTTRPDTLYGVTYVVLAPEHALIRTLLPHLTNAKEVEAYIATTAQKTERERSENKEKTGIRLEGVEAINPATKEEIPVYVADYVLGSYGTGAVMAVPAHDERDFEFAHHMQLPIRPVVVARYLDETNPPQEGKEDTTRTIIIGIVHNPKDDTYLCLSWKKEEWTTFITGGIDEGEDPIAAAKREIAEETGYTDLKFVRILGAPTSAEFFASHKGVNRVTHAIPILFELASDAHQAVAKEEAAQHEPLWIPSSKIVGAKLQHAEFGELWRRIQSGMDAYTEPGVLMNSGSFTGQKSEEAKWGIVEAVGGERATQYRIRDWLVSRQRYWGCPIPVVYDPEGKPHPIPAEHLPWLLPTDVDFKPTGKAPLASSKELQERVTALFGEGWTPEYDTLDTFVDSSWYFLRYLDSSDDHDFSDQSLMKKWMPVKRYSGGSEHTTMHLLYARFFTKALYDLALVPVDEPFTERFNRGLIMGPDGQKMSKSKGNVVNPDEFVAKYGADAVRLFLAFIGPYNEPGSYPWSLEGVASMRKFLERIVRVSSRLTMAEPTPELQRAFAEATLKIAADSDRFKFNTAVSALMILVNALEEAQSIPKPLFKEFLILLSPFAPHVSEHLWELLGEEGSVHAQSWPQVTVEEAQESEVVVQVNGKRRAALLIPRDMDESEVIMKARALLPIRAVLMDKEPRRVVYVPGKIINFVV